MEKGRSVFKILTRLLEKPRHRWQGSVRMDLKKIGVNAKNWVGLAHDGVFWRALVNAALNLLSFISYRVS